MSLLVHVLPAPVVFLDAKESYFPSSMEDLYLQPSVS